ncbi:NAD(P)/FAD-dependent oxidoreductase [Salinibacter ruber]|uniref:NAD(P)/FAD-dependent oxidoreductase n=1 Tax=Salinibacter ruber TaxID=146919 RepID=UPI0021692A31|nr:NAD(P)/FAD-dependent oxidoreductase [Salinibacter ruber]MCS4198628.1 NADH dehydrogenase [Salinibacter ruber]
MPFDTPSSTSDRPHVVIVGAGFAGLEAAKALRDAPVRVTLVDRNNYHKFQPLLYEVAMAGLEPDDIAHNVRNIFQGNETVNFRLGTVVDIDPARQQVHLHGSQSLSYDHLILAAGAVSTDFGIPGVEEHAYPLKNVPDAVNLRNRVLRQFERYDRQRAGAEEGALTFVVVGGGPTGVEMAGAFVELFDTLNDDFAQFDTREEARCLLLEMEDDLLPPYKAPQRAYTRQVLEARGVDVQTNTAVERVAPDRVYLADGRVLPTQTLVWAAGVKASPVANLLDAEQDRADRVVVSPDLTVPEHPDVYVVGDMAAIEGEDGYEPQLAQVAIQSGRHAADQIQRRLRDGTTERFEYWDLGQMATIGRNAAVAEFAGGIAFRGFMAWFLWVVIHIAKLVGFRNRLSALVNWAYNYFTYSRSARLILDAVPLSDDGPMEAEAEGEQVTERPQTVGPQP